MYKIPAVTFCLISISTLLFHKLSKEAHTDILRRELLQSIMRLS